MKWSNMIQTLTVLAILSVTATQQVMAANVKITPLGSNTGEFCQLDRAMVLEDPEGTRILYDPGRSRRK